MNPQERADKISRIAVDPRTRSLNAQHDQLVKRLLTAMGNAMDTFIKRFLLRHFPYAVQDRLEKFGAVATEDCAGAFSGLLEACNIQRIEYTAPFKGEDHNCQARVMSFVRGETDLARLEIRFKDGTLHADEFVANDSESTRLVFGYGVPAIRIFFWRLCQSKHAPLADISRRHYIIRFGVEPEPTLESIDFEAARPGVSVEDSAAGEQQRPTDDRG